IRSASLARTSCASFSNSASSRISRRSVAASSACAGRITTVLIGAVELVVEQLAPPVFERRFAGDLRDALAGAYETRAPTRKQEPVGAGGDRAARLGGVLRHGVDQVGDDVAGFDPFAEPPLIGNQARTRRFYDVDTGKGGRIALRLGQRWRVPGDEAAPLEEAEQGSAIMRSQMIFDVGLAAEFDRCREAGHGNGFTRKARLQRRPRRAPCLIE